MLFKTFNNSFVYCFIVIVGGIFNEIGCLMNFKELNFYEGKFSGLILFNIFNILMMEMIDLFMNELCGYFFLSMGRWFLNFKIFILYDNNFSGMILSFIVNVLKFFIMDLISNLFFGFISNNFGDLEFLERLLFGGNNLNSENVNLELMFFFSLMNCKNLKLLGMVLNLLGGFFLVLLGNFFFFF